MCVCACVCVRACVCVCVCYYASFMYVSMKEDKYTTKANYHEQYLFYLVTNYELRSNAFSRKLFHKIARFFDACRSYYDAPNHSTSLSKILNDLWTADY